MEMSCCTCQTSFGLHGIRDQPTYYFDSRKSNSQLSEILPASDCCLNYETGVVPLYGVTWQCSNTEHIRDISTFVSLNEDVIRAAHALFDEKGHPLPCFVAPATTEIPGSKFLADRYMRVPGSQQGVAHHALIFPSSAEGIREDGFDRIGRCETPENGWAVCKFVATAEANPSFSYPDGPDDQLMARATLALEKYIALNCELSGNLRRSARILQYHLANKDWEDLKDESIQVCRLVLLALEMWEVDGFAGLNIFMRGETRCMIGNLKFWIERGEFEES